MLMAFHEHAVWGGVLMWNRKNGQPDSTHSVGKNVLLVVGFVEIEEPFAQAGLLSQETLVALFLELADSRRETGPRGEDRRVHCVASRSRASQRNAVRAVCRQCFSRQTTSGFASWATCHGARPSE